MNPIFITNTYTHFMIQLVSLAYAKLEPSYTFNKIIGIIHYLNGFLEVYKLVGSSVS